MYFDRRRSRRTRWPVSRSAMRGGKGQRRSARFTRASAISLPAIAGSSPRRTVSTSGSSGIGHSATDGSKGVHCSPRARPYKEGAAEDDKSP